MAASTIRSHPPRISADRDHVALIETDASLRSVFIAAQF
jgi:hypothetical protein